MDRPYKSGERLDSAVGQFETINHCPVLARRRKEHRFSILAHSYFIMSSKDSEMKVIIAGGSIAGLSLALMLEKNGIDFLVLEAYRDIAPQAGASIGLLPNGLRILDQLGCYDQVLTEAEYPVEKVTFRDSSGKTFWSFDDFNKRITERFVIPYPYSLFKDEV